MTEELIKDLDPRLRKQLDTAEKSIGRNAGYAVDVCIGILSRNPGCYEVRQILRKAQNKAAGTKPSGLGRFIKNVTNAPFAMKLNGMVAKDPQAAMEAAEKLITANPSNIPAHKIVGQAAEALELHNTAVVAYESIREIDANNLENNVALGNALLNAERPQDAIRIGDAILQANPGNDAAQDLIRRASVQETMEKGKWEEDASFRDKLADEEQAIELEQSSRVANDDETLAKMNDKLIEAIEAEPENINNYRDIINNYRKLNDYDNALLYLAKAQEVPSGKADPTLERLGVDLKVQAMNFKLSSQREALAADPENAELQASIAELEKEEHAFRLENAQRMVDKYPNDYAARYELGKLLYTDGQYDPAIQQFQLAQRNPKVRLNAILDLGRTYTAKSFWDLAVEQLEIAKADITTMNDLKKEVIYELATAYEKMGQEAKAIDEFKIIYAADIGYLDVSDKINTFYAKQQNS